MLLQIHRDFICKSGKSEIIIRKRLIFFHLKQEPDVHCISEETRNLKCGKNFLFQYFQFLSYWWHVINIRILFESHLWSRGRYLVIVVININSAGFVQYNKNPSIYQLFTLADLRFSKRGCLLFGNIFPENCMKIKKIVPRRGNIPSAPILGSPMIRLVIRVFHKHTKLAISSSLWKLRWKQSTERVCDGNEALFRRFLCFERIWIGRRESLSTW